MLEGDASFYSFSLCEILRLFSTATRMLEGDALTLPEVPRVLNQLRVSLQNIVNDEESTSKAGFTVDFLEALNKRLGFVFNEVNLALLAAAMHPSYGHLSFISEELRDQVWQELGRQVKRLPLLETTCDEEKEAIYEMISWQLPLPKNSISQCN